MGARTAACLFAAVIAAAEAAPQPQIVFVNEAALPQEQARSLQAELGHWGLRVYRYLGVDSAPPVTAQVTRRVTIGYYSAGTVFLPVSDRMDMVETWVHELAHHVTGHDSSFFFKEGIAVHTQEAVFREAGLLPQSWPNYGEPSDDWVRLFVARGVMPSLDEALAWPRFRGATPQEDFRSWQVYLVAGSFVGWYLREHGHAAFADAFRRQRPGQPQSEMEAAWRRALAATPLRRFDPAAALPDKPRYRGYAQRLRAP